MATTYYELLIHRFQREYLLTNVFGVAWELRLGGKSRYGVTFRALIVVVDTLCQNYAHWFEFLQFIEYY